MKLTRITALCLALIPVALHAQKIEHSKLDLVWDMHPAEGFYANKETGVSFTQYMGGFKGINAYTFSKDGISRFEYWQEKGMVDVYLARRAALNLPRQGDNAAQFFKNYRPLLLNNAGKVESETSSDLVYHANGKQGKGRKISLFLVSSPKFNGRSVYDEFGVVQIGEVLVYYRGTFVSKEGLDDLAKFLRALGITSR